tara:strand:+ start:473 stop:1015 length:543 start_codon:yes stop_codon:yes gene_type:complete
MAEVTPAKNNLQQEEVDFKSALSEQLMTKMAGSINFINDRQMCVFDFKFFGPFKALSGGEDGCLMAPFDLEICAIAFKLRQCGTGGNTEVDMHKLTTAGVDAGTVFSTTIKCAHNEINEKTFYTNFIDSSKNDVDQAASHLPIMSDANRLVDAGENLRLDIVSNATDAFDLQVTVFYRPR